MISLHKTYQFLIAVLLIINYSLVYAQPHIFCNTQDHFIEAYQSSSVQKLKEYQKFEKAFLKNFGRKSAVMDTVPVHHHVAVMNGITKVSEEQIISSMAEVNDYFAPANIYFKIKEISYEETFLWTYDVVEERNQMLAIRSKDAVNIFYTNQNVQFGSGAGQFANEFGIFGSGASGGFLTHEMGHIFGLFHPHGKYSSFKPNYENFRESRNGFPYPVYIEGAVRYYDRRRDDNENGVYDCLETGDEVCDTPAEALFGGEQICSESSFEYTGDLVDYFGDKYWTDLGNVMSYNCGGGFTTGQYARIRYTYENLLYFLHCDKCNCDDELVVSKSDNHGIGSFGWAKTCAEVLKGEDDMKKIILDVPGNEINLENRTDIVFRYDNYHIESVNGRTIINPSPDFDFNDEISFVGNNVTIKNIHFKDLGGIYFYDPNDGSSNDNVIQDLNIEDCIFENLTNDLGFLRVQDFRFSGNQIVGDGGKGVFVLSIEGGEILNNRFESEERYGLRIAEGEDCNIDNNYFTNSPTGLWVQDFSTLSVSENEFKNLSSTGVLLENVTSASLTNNKIGGGSEDEKIGSSGIYIYGQNNSDLLIEANQIQNCSTGLSLTDGIYENVNVSRNKVFNNRDIGFEIRNFNSLDLVYNEVLNNRGGGIQLIGGVNGFLHLNIVDDNGNNGVEILECLSVLFRVNEISNNTRNGVTVSNSEDIKVGTHFDLGNLIYGNGRAGISLSDVLSYEVKGNSIGCNGFGINIFPQESELQDVIVEIVNNDQISGTGQAGALVEIYTNKSNCPECQFHWYLGSTTVNGNGEWVLQSEKLNLEDGENINAIMHVEGKARVAANCFKADLEVSCSNVPEINDFQDSYEICQGTSLDLDSGNDTDTHQWFYNGDVLQQTTSKVEFSQEGNYRLVISNKEGCTVESFFTVKEIEELSISLDVDEEICENSSHIMRISTDATKITWFKDDEPLDVINPREVDYSEAGIYKVVVENDAGCTNSETVEIKRLATPNLEIILKNEMCEGESALLFAQFDQSDEFSRWYVVENREAVDLNISTSDLIINNPGLYVAEVMSENGCRSSRSIRIEARPSPSANMSVPDVICEGETSELRLDTNGEVKGWFLDGRNLGTTVFDLEVDTPGEYNARVVSEFGCESSVTKILNAAPKAALSVSGNDTFCEGESTTLIVTTDAPQVSWYLDDDLFASNELSLDINTPGFYTIVADGNNICESSESINITKVTVEDISLDLSGELCEGETITISSNTGGGNNRWFLDDELIAESEFQIEIGQAGVYSLEVSSGDNCEAERSIRVEQRELPTFSFDTPDQACIGETVLLGLTSSGIIDNLNSSETEIEIKEPGDYSFTISNEFGCSTKAESSIEFFELPSLSLSKLDPFCEGDTVSLIADTQAESIVWLLDNSIIEGSNDFELFVSESGEYSVRVTSSDGCSAETETLLETIDCTTSTQDIDAIDLISVYPNPTSNNLIIERAHALGQQGQYKIFSIDGDLLKLGELRQAVNTISIEDLVSAPYLLMIYEGEEVFFKKILKLD